MSDDLKRLIEEQHRHAQQWLEQHRRNIELAPKVQEIATVLSWALDTTTNSPTDKYELPTHHLTSMFHNNEQLMQDALPPMPSYDATHINNLHIATTAGGTVLYNALTEADGWPVAEVKAWSVQYAPQYVIIQEAQHRRDRVRALLYMLRPELADEFDVAETAYQAESGGLQLRIAAAIAMRNVLEHYQGRLFEKSLKRSTPKSERWQKMVEELSKSPVGDPLYTQLLDQERLYTYLQGELSKMAKKQPWSNSIDLTALHTTFLDHLYTVLSIVRLS